MRILAIECASVSASVAVTEGDRCLCSDFVKSGLTHSQTLMPMLEKMLQENKIDINSIDMFACTAGPGSFTGVRIGVSALKGLAEFNKKPCFCVSTLEAIYYPHRNFDGVVCAVMDARRSQVYNALFEIRDGMPVRLTEDRAISLEELKGDVEALNSDVFLVGDGASITSSFFEAHHIPWRAAPSNLAMQSAWGVAMAAQGKKGGSADDLLPVYLRLSQAERERQERMAKG